MNRESESMNIVATLAKEKKLIFCIFLSIVALGCIIIFSGSKNYKVQSLIQVGSVPGKDALVPIEDPHQVIEKINQGVFNDPAMTKFLKISAKDESINIISVSITAHDVDASKQLISFIDSKIIADHQKKFDAQLTAFSDTTKEMEARFEAGRYNGSSDNTANVILAVSQNKNLAVAANPTVILRDPVVVPMAGQGKVQKLIFTVFVAAFLAIFAALFREWWVRGLRQV